MGNIVDIYRVKCSEIHSVTVHQKLFWKYKIVFVVKGVYNEMEELSSKPHS